MHENCPYASEMKDLVSGPSSLCISMCVLIYIVILYVACSTGTCYKNTGKHPPAEHYRIPQSAAPLQWTGPQGERKEFSRYNKPQGPIKEEQDEKDRQSEGNAQEIRERLGIYRTSNTVCT